MSLKTLRFLALIAVCVCFGASLSAHAAWAASGDPEKHYDVVVVGAGTGGTAAAIQSARMGARVAVIEETDWIGGQMTAAAVSTMDDLSHNMSGIYREFVDRVREHYDKMGKSIATCYWGKNTIAFEPSVGQQILYDMISETRSRTFPGRRKATLDLYLKSRVLRVQMDKDHLRAITVDVDGRPTLFTASVFIDATECGDLIPLTGARYRAGNSISPHIRQDAKIQDITWAAVIKKYPQGVPPSLLMRTPPEGYEKNLDIFRRFVSQDGSAQIDEYPIRLPVNFVVHNAYRGLPDRSNPDDYGGQGPEAWPRITKTEINWANDYPGSDGISDESPGLPVSFLENHAVRRKISFEALAKTLQFLYYIQNELGEEDWSVADDEFASSVWKESDLPEAFKPYWSIVRRFPPIPYVRESRRLVGIRTLTASEIHLNSASYRNGLHAECPTSLAIGGYNLDLHGATTDRDLEADLGENATTFDREAPLGPFQVPFEIFIPERVDGLVAAEKNLSTSRIANGALRLQPITMLTGQAAGAIAALSVQDQVEPRQVPPIKVQMALLKSGSTLALAQFFDVPEAHPYWPAVQIVTLHGLMDPVSYPDVTENEPFQKMAPRQKGFFGINNPLHRSEMADSLVRAFKDTILALPSVEILLQRDPNGILLWGDLESILPGSIDGHAMGAPVFRGEGANWLVDLFIDHPNLPHEGESP